MLEREKQLLENYRLYLIHLENYYNSYHNQKELAAWRLVVYAASVTALTFTIFYGLVEFGVPSLVTLILVSGPPLILFTNLVSLYQKQSDMRAVASLVVISCRDCLHEIVKQVHIPPRQIRNSLDASERKDDPTILHDEIFDTVPAHFRLAAKRRANTEHTKTRRTDLFTSLQLRTIYCFAATAAFPSIYFAVTSVVELFCELVTLWDLVVLLLYGLPLSFNNSLALTP